MECDKLCGAIECVQSGRCQAQKMVPIPKRFIGADRFKHEAREHLSVGRISQQDYEAIQAMEDISILQTFGGETFPISEREEEVDVYAIVGDEGKLQIGAPLYPLDEAPQEIQEHAATKSEFTCEGKNYKTWRLTISKGYPLCRIYTQGKIVQGNANDYRRVFRGENRGKHRLYSFFSYPTGRWGTWITDFRNDPYV